MDLPFVPPKAVKTDENFAKQMEVARAVMRKDRTVLAALAKL